MVKKDYPIQVIQVRNSDHKPPPDTMSIDQKVFGEVTSALRESLSAQSNSLLDYFEQHFNQWPDIPIVAKVTLKEEALAKSHRPVALFSPTTCPIIGTLDFGEILVSATRDGLARLSRRILTTESKKPVANISAIEKIEPFKSKDRLRGFGQDDFSRCADENITLKLRSFSHGNIQTDTKIKEALISLADQFGIELEEIHYGKRQTFLKMSATNDNANKAFSSFIGLQALSPMPNYSLNDLKLQTTSVGKIDESLCPPPLKEQEYPVVGVIDSGVCKKSTYLSPWIVAREHYVPEHLQDNSHGTMVAGLIVNGRALNQNDIRFPDAQAKIVDIAVFENGKELKEDDLVAIIEEVVEKYHSDVKVWNLSLGSSEPTLHNEFSDFACFLDEMHDVYQCLFVVASGNHAHLQSWPPTIDDGGLARVSSPGDSVRSLTVGSIANKSNPNSLSKTEEPSPFSRRGPGPNYIPKPEITQYGGNCSVTQNYAQTGILSVGPNNAHFESVGTSFATPLASAQAAVLWKMLESSETPCVPERVKALMVHSALVRSHLVTSDTINYYGFGQPGDVIDTLYCDPNAITMMFETDLRHGGHEFERWPFPIPDCLITEEGKFKGEVLMTLVYSPIIDRDYASEYCRTNVDAALGSYKKGDDGKYKFDSLIPVAPKDINQLYEKFRIENGFKWSPVKAYHKKFPRGTMVDTWRLKMKVARRAEKSNPGYPQRATLLLTLRSEDTSYPVYNDTMIKMNQAGWLMYDIDQHLRVKIDSE